MTHIKAPPAVEAAVRRALARVDATLEETKGTRDQMEAQLAHLDAELVDLNGRAGELRAFLGAQA